MAGICGECGKPVSEDFMFCGSCGARIEPPAHQEPQTDTDSETLYPPDSEPDPLLDRGQLPLTEQEPQFSSTPITVEFEHIADCRIEPVLPAPPPPPSRAATIGKVFLSIILGILLFAFTLAIAALIILRPSKIPEIVAGADVTWVLEETDIGEVVVEGLNQSDIIKKHIDLDVIKDFLNRENVSAEFGAIAEKYAQAIADGDFDYYLNSTDIVSSIKAIAPEIYEEFGALLTDDDLDLIAESIDEYVDLTEFSVMQVMEQSSVDVAVPHAIFSTYPLIIVCLLCALVVFNIVLLHRRKAGNALLATGIPVSVSGLVYLAVGMFTGPLTGLIANNTVYGAFRLAAGMTTIMLILGFGLLILGIAAIILFTVAVKARVKRQLFNFDNESGIGRQGSHKQGAKNKQSGNNRQGGNTWVVVGLTTNLCMLAACAFLFLLFYLNL